jgi:hypothetical protein
MRNESRFASTTFLVLSLAIGVVACKPTNSPSDSGTDAGADGPTMGSDTAPTTTGTKPLAYGCSANNECSSGFCVDGVCCDSACDQQCTTCNVVGAAGHCVGQLFGDDVQAAEPCTGAHTCGVDIQSPTLASCKLKNQQHCSAPADCASANCATYYEDLDADGYGSSNAVEFCDNNGAAAPPGYSTISGDCCDHDLAANPSATAYYTSESACGSWDFNCDGKIEAQNGYSSMYCGQTLGTGSLSGHVTVACH